MSALKISVAIATYNGEKYIREQLISILEQLDENAEVVISDDGSTDKTIEIIQSLNDQRITILHNNSDKKGPTENFENALKRVTGDIVFLADQDDVWLNNKVSVMSKQLERYYLVVCDCKVTDQNLNVTHTSFFELINAGPGLMKNIIRNTYHGCAMAFRKEVLEIAVPFPKHIPMHDMWIGFVAELFFNPHFIKDKLLLHRRHNNNASSASAKSKHNFTQKFMFRFNLLRYIPLLIKRKLQHNIH